MNQVTTEDFEVSFKVTYKFRVRNNAKVARQALAEVALRQMAQKLQEVHDDLTVEWLCGCDFCEDR
jgi:hypothetical protein